ncbi:MAG: nucleotidyltransferase family protein [Butyrivibrio sp.]|nr:nucleotidyltransferase family protein [Butyrivibrio sp.]
MSLNNNQQAFFELLRAGLWNKEARLSKFGAINLKEICRIAEEQSVVGLVAAGLEHVTDVKLPKEEVLMVVGQTLQLEQRNKAMNAFVSELISRLKDAGINALLVKGQGIAQCYEKPLWRACGDVDLLLNADDYEKAKKLLMPLATDVETEYTHFKHVGMTIPNTFGRSDKGRADGWVVELHGTLHSRLSKRVDKQIDAVQEDTFKFGNVRAWDNGGVTVFLPAVDNDVVFVFTHILHHFFFEGIGLRQICDWCRLLWTYRNVIDVTGLALRLDEMGIMSEWKAFAAYAVEYLGISAEAMPLYSDDAKWSRKAARINAFVLEVGNFGHKQRRDYNGMSYLRRKFVSFWGRLSDMLRHFRIFPLDSIRFFGGVLRSGLHAAVRGE